MPLMIDAEPLMELLAAVDAADEPRYALVQAFRELQMPVTPEQTEQFYLCPQGCIWRLAWLAVRNDLSAWWIK